MAFRVSIRLALGPLTLNLTLTEQAYDPAQLKWISVPSFLFKRETTDIRGVSSQVSQKVMSLNKDAFCC